jgi:hypothetical protein
LILLLPAIINRIIPIFNIEIAEIMTIVSKIGIIILTLWYANTLKINIFLILLLAFGTLFPFGAWISFIILILIPSKNEKKEDTKIIDSPAVDKKKEEKINKEKVEKDKKLIRVKEKFVNAKAGVILFSTSLFILSIGFLVTISFFIDFLNIKILMTSILLFLLDITCLIFLLKSKKDLKIYKAKIEEIMDKDFKDFTIEEIKKINRSEE